MRALFPRHTGQSRAILHEYGAGIAMTSGDIRFEVNMKADIHPKYEEINVTCGCGNVFLTRSTHHGDLRIDVCSSCHPFFTGKQKVADQGGRVDKFNKRFGQRKV